MSRPATSTKSGGRTASRSSTRSMSAGKSGIPGGLLWSGRGIDGNPMTVRSQGQPPIPKCAATQPKAPTPQMRHKPRLTFTDIVSVLSLDCGPASVAKTNQKLSKHLPALLVPALIWINPRPAEPYRLARSRCWGGTRRTLDPLSACTRYGFSGRVLRMSLSHPRGAFGSLRCWRRR